MYILDDLRAATELFIPKHCLVCGATGCVSGLCRVCRRIAGLKLARPQAVPDLDFQVPVYAAGEYDGVLARCLLGYKEHLRTDIRDILASGLARSISVYTQHQPVVLVPVPSSPKSVARRGFSPALDLTHHASRILRTEHDVVVAEVIGRKNRVFPQRAQKQLGRYDRQQQIKNRLKIIGNFDVGDAPCVVVDDVTTTGASLKEATRVLEDAGAQILGCATVAWVRRQQSL